MSENAVHPARLYFRPPGGSIEEINANLARVQPMIVAMAPSVEHAAKALERLSETMRAAKVSLDVTLDSQARGWIDAAINRQYSVTPDLRQQLKQKGRPGWKRQR